MPAPEPSSARAVPPGLDVVFADDHLAVINKPAGLLSVPGKGEANQDCVVARVQQLFPRATGPLVVHRLDMDTSGLLVVALNAQAQRLLSAQFERRSVEKDYLALVEGDVHADAGEVCLPIRLDPANRPVQVVDFVHGRPALTRYQVLSRETDRTRLRLVPITGRTHQLRVHCAAPQSLGGLGCPIQGDVLYGDGRASAPRLLLHAQTLRLHHPETHQSLSWTSQAPF